MNAKSMILVVSSLALGLSGCATHPDKIAAGSTSPMKYHDYNCRQIAAEYDRVTNKANEIYARLRGEAGRDSAAMAAGLFLFWPALFLLEGSDGPEAYEYAKLKGERDTIEEVAISKKCGLASLPLQAEEDKKKASQESKERRKPY